MLGRRRTILMFLVTMLPVALTILHRIMPHSRTDADRFIPMITMTFYLMFVTVLIALFYGTAVIADEIDGKTVTYLFMRPVRKARILLSKFVAYLVGAIALIAPSHLIATLINCTDPTLRDGLFSQIGMSLQYIGVISLGLLVYGAIFSAFGARFKHAVLWGLIVAFGWEKITLVVPGNIKKFSAIHYLLSIYPRKNLPRSPIREMLGESPVTPWLAVLIILLITALFLSLSVRIFNRREYYT